MMTVCALFYFAIIAALSSLISIPRLRLAVPHEFGWWQLRLTVHFLLSWAGAFSCVLALVGKRILGRYLIMFCSGSLAMLAAVVVCKRFIVYFHGAWRVMNPYEIFRAVCMTNTYHVFNMVVMTLIFLHYWDKEQERKKMHG